MKNMMSILVVLAIIFVFAGCNTNMPTSNENSAATSQSFGSMGNIKSSENAVEITGQNELNTLGREVLDGAFYAGMLYTSWNHPSKLDPEVFSAFYIWLHSLDESAEPYVEFDKLGAPMVSQDKLESQITACFDVTVDYLRQSQHYHGESKLYTLVELGGAWSCEVISAVRKRDILEIKFQFVDSNGDIGQTGMLIVQEADSGYRYLSCIVD